MDSNLTATDRTAAEISAIQHGAPARLVVLDSLRGIAALIVVIHHCFLTQPAFCEFFFSTWQIPATTFLQYMLFHTPARIIWNGYEAVTLFYVLSGLVLALPWAERRPPTYGVFAIKRICRIYLPYCAAILIAASCNLLLIQYSNVPGASRWVTEMNWTRPISLWTLFDHAVMYGHRNSVNGVIHSLIWEMRVSLLFPVLVLPVVWFRWKGAAGLLAALVAFVLLIQVSIAHGFGPHYALLSDMQSGGVAKIAYEIQWTAYYACFFIFGALIAFYLPQIRSRILQLSQAGRLLVLACGLLMFQGHWSRIHSVQETVIAMGSVLLIVAAISGGVIERTLLFRPLLFVGRISYSLYLVHVPIILCMVALLQSAPLWLLLSVVPPMAIFSGWLFDIAVAKPCAALGLRLAARLRKGRAKQYNFLNTVKPG